jgi:radical SAM protein with 4Fe4S-binding SPASM domain
MPIDFSLTEEQKIMKETARRFANEELLPVVSRADELEDPWESFTATKEVYKKAYELGFAMSFIPSKYGGLGVSNIDFQIVAEEICAVDPGFACTLLVNGLALLPILWFGSEFQKDYWLRKATSDPQKEFIAGWVVSEPAGTANFDSDLLYPAGIQLIADYDADNQQYILNGRKMWNTNACGWDKSGADVSVVIARIDKNKSGRDGLAAFIVPKDTDGMTTTGILNTLGHRTTVQPEILFDNCRIPKENLLPGSLNNGNLVITKAFNWSGPIAGIAAVGVMRSAYNFALEWAKNYCAGGGYPIINFQNVGYMLSNIKMKIEASRYLCWKAAHYLDEHNAEGYEVTALSKIFCGELAVEAVCDAMKLVGINSYLMDYPLQKNLRDALCFPIYDAGNMGMQRRRLHGIIANKSYDPLSIAENRPSSFSKQMLGFNTMPGHDASISYGYAPNKIQKISDEQMIYFKQLRKSIEEDDENIRKGKYKRAPVFPSETLTKAEIEKAKKRESLLYLNLEFINECNLGCEGCWNGYATDPKEFDSAERHRPNSELGEKLTIGEYCAIIDQAKELGVKYIDFIGGGEPLISNDFFSLVSYARSRGINIETFTNGTLIDNKTARLLFDFDVVPFVKVYSLNPERHDHMVNRRGAHAKVMKAIKLLQDVGYADSYDPPLVMESIITMENYNEIPEMWRFARDNKMIPYFERFVGLNYRGKENNLPSPRELRDLWLRILKIDQDEYGFSFPLLPLRIGYSCSSAFFSLYIQSDGIVRPCAGSFVEVGNLRTQDLQEILQTSEIVKDLRELSVSNNNKGVCKLCPYFELLHCPGCRGMSLFHTNSIVSDDPLCFHIINNLNKRNGGLVVSN